MEILDGYKNVLGTDLVLGHEFVGRVVGFEPLPPPAAPPLLRLESRVVAEINCTSPTAAEASSSTWRTRAQDPTRSALGIFGANGCFATHVVVPLANLHAVPPSVSDRSAVFTEPLAAAAAVAEEMHVRASDKVGVLGAGRLGVLIAAALSAARIDVVLLARDVRGRGARVIGEVACSRPVVVRDSANGDEDGSFDVVVEATGCAAGLQRALQLVRPRGTVVLKSTYAVGGAAGAGDKVDLAMVVVKEITVKGSRCGHFPTALKMLEDGAVRPAAMIEKIFGLDEAVEAFECAKRKGTLKVLFEPSLSNVEAQ